MWSAYALRDYGVMWSAYALRDYGVTGQDLQNWSVAEVERSEFIPLGGASSVRTLISDLARWAGFAR